MAEKAKNNKSIIIGICVAALVIIAIIIAIVLINKNQTINDAYFKSDDTKYVLTLDADDYDSDEDQEHAPLKTHTVYYYKGNEITDLKTYLEYTDNDAAKAALDYVTTNESDNYKEITVNGKYLILTSNDVAYEGVTADEVKQQIEFIESLKNFNFGTEDEDIDDTTIEETVEE